MDIATIPTPPGPFSVISDGDTVLASGWTAKPDRLLALIAPRLRPGPLTVRPELGAITDAVRRYMAGDLSSIDDVAVRQAAGPVLEGAWDVLRTIPAGAPITYAELAAKCGRPAAARVAGGACARNAAALFVPCHRVVRTGGGLGGFGWGLPVKRWLLDHEAGSGILPL
jgi:methylated-DNA-[protein]-cysteine S-methyltransferase